MRRKLAYAGIVLPLVLILDIVTKRWALEALASGPREGLFGGLVPFTLAFNRGAAFGLSVGNDPRWFFIPVTILALVLLTSLLVQTPGRDRFRVLALVLIISGAIGNLIDRVRWDRGVVDFLGPVDLGFMDWPIFNVADMAISCGAVALALSFFLEERRERRAARPAGEPGGVDDPPPTSVASEEMPTT